MPSDFEIKITTKAELAGAQATAKYLEGQIAKAKELKRDYSGLDNTLGLVNRSIQNFKPPVSRWGQFFDGIKDKLREIIPGFRQLESAIASMGVRAGLAVAALGGLAATVAVSVREFMKAETAAARLDIALAQTGQLTDDYRKKLFELSGQLQRTTNVSDEEWQMALARLIQFGAKEGDIAKLAQAVSEAALVMNTDVPTAAIAMGKAMQGSFTQFSRYLGEVSSLDDLLQKLSKRGIGGLGVDAETTSGKLKRFGNNLSDTLEVFGKWTLKIPGVIQLLVHFGDAFERFNAWIGGTPVKLKGLQNAQEKTIENLNEEAKSTKQLEEERKKTEAGLKTLSKAYDDYLRQLETEAELAGKVREAKLKERMAFIEFAERSGLMTKEQAERERFAETQGAEDTNYTERRRLIRTQLREHASAYNRAGTDEERNARALQIKSLDAELQNMPLVRQSESAAAFYELQSASIEKPNAKGEGSAVLQAIKAGRRADAAKNDAIAAAFAGQEAQWKQQQREWLRRFQAIKTQAANLRNQ